MDGSRQFRRRNASLNTGGVKMTTQLNYRGVKYNGTITHKTIESQEMLYRGVKHNPTLREQWVPATSGIYRGSKWSV